MEISAEASLWIAEICCHRVCRACGISVRGAYTACVLLRRSARFAGSAALKMCACAMLATKLCDTKPAKLDDILKFSGLGASSVDALEEMERTIVAGVTSIHVATPFDYLGGPGETLVTFFVHVALHSHRLSSLHPRELATVCRLLADRVVSGSDLPDPAYRRWVEILETKLRDVPGFASDIVDLLRTNNRVTWEKLATLYGWGGSQPELINLVD